MNYFSWETWGWLSAICFGLCGVPQAIKSIKDKHSDGVSWGLLILWGVGEIFATIYVLPRKDYPLLVNYFFNALFIAIIIYYKIIGASNDKTRN